MLSMSKMSKIDQIHLKAVMLYMSKMGKEHTDIFFIIPFLIWYHFNVMLCMSKMSKMGKQHTHTFWLITSLNF